MTKPRRNPKSGQRRKNQYRDVADMVRQVVDDQDFVADFEQTLGRRQIVKDLMALRAAAGLSQKDIAAKLRCTQSRVSKLERSNDGDLRLGDFIGYSGILGFNVTIVLTPKGWTAVDEVKYHAFCIKDLLDHLAGLAKKDHSVARGVATFFEEARVNLGRILQDSAKTVIATLKAFTNAPLLHRPETDTIKIKKRMDDVPANQSNELALSC